MPPKSKAATDKASQDDLVDRIEHKDGCPADRQEVSTLRRPDNQGGGTVRVARCIECGEQATRSIKQEVADATEGKEDGDGD